MTERAPPPPPILHAPPSRRRWLLIVGVLAIAVPIAAFVIVGGLFLQVGGWMSFHMAAGSMVPSLEVGDHFLVDPKAYGGGVLPKRGDVILFYPPAGLLPGQPGRRAPFVKRVVGVPGDRIQMVDGVPVLNGVPVVQEALGDYRDGAHPSIKGRRIRERLPDGVSYEILKIASNGMLDQSPIFLVPPASYFVMGDNRDDSLDSRTRLGSASIPGWYVPLSDVVGQAKYIYWSGFERFGRMGTAVK